MSDGRPAVDPGSISLATSPETAVHTLLAARAASATICPSDAARLVAGPRGNWRAAMGRVHEAVDRMHRDGVIALSWQGRPLEARVGPYRIARPA